ncbi:ArsR/SmtB family transcription factor [Oerskovia flava]|uniref:ArsR/SmtB family transcription factor n=1 Tax=Oerskovia flava TaxID=2986422 RepID=UPI00224079E7|nr:helix-turn-helix domain-containing protein [Oerskovia sp. JB1-3-2]
MSFDDSPLGSLRALSHPLRLRILKLLEASGPLTATQVAQRVEASPSNCSFHLRVLAREGFITEAPGGSGRARPWRLVPQVVDVDVDTLDDDGRAQLRHAVVALVEQYRRTTLEWLDRRDELPADWRQAATSRQMLLRLTAAELTEINDRISELFAPFVDRVGDDPHTPDDARSVAVTLATLPVLPTTPERDS